MCYTDVKPLQWHVLKGILPRYSGRGRPFRDHRQVINGILWRIKAGAPWRLIPRAYGPWQTCYDRFWCWERNGTWEKVLEILRCQQGDSIDWDKLAHDSTTTKAHRSARGARHQPAREDAHRRVIEGVWTGHVGLAPTAWRCGSAAFVASAPNARTREKRGRASRATVLVAMIMIWL